MKLDGRFLLYYCTIFVLFITLMGLVSARDVQTLITQIVFLPVTAFLVYTSYREFRRLRILGNQSYSGTAISLTSKKFIFSIILFVILAAVGFYNLKTGESKNSPFPDINLNHANTQVVVKSAPEASKSASRKLVKVKITDGSKSVNIREEPATGSKAIGEANNGEEFVLISKEPDWYSVELPDKRKGWIYRSYLVEE